MDRNHCEGHLTTYDENQQQNKRTVNDFTCYCGKKCKGLRGLTAHIRSCVASNFDDLKTQFTKSDAKKQSETNYWDEESTPPQLEKNPVKECVELPTTKEEC